MELNIFNQSLTPMVVFVSNQKFDNSQLLDMIKPKDILAKIAYDHYWKKKTQQDINSDLTNYIRLRTKSLMECIGRCQNSGDKVQMNNINRVPEWGYVFQIRYSDNKASLYIAMIPIMGFFVENDTYLVSVFNIYWFDLDPAPPTTTHDEASQILNVEYRDPGRPLSEYLLDWKPDFDNKPKEPWLFFGLVLIMLLVVILAIIGAFFVIYHTTKQVTNHVNKNVTLYTDKKEKQVEYL